LRAEGTPLALAQCVRFGFGTAFRQQARGAFGLFARSHDALRGAGDKQDDALGAVSARRAASSAWRRIVAMCAQCGQARRGSHFPKSLKRHGLIRCQSGINWPA
jgi:hypothetical protein